MTANFRESNGQVFLPVPGITQLLSEIFVRAGASIDEAYGISSHLVDATLAGHDSHGIIRVPRYLVAVKEGHVKFDQTATPVVDSESFVLLEGHHGFGQTLGKQATKIGIEKARKHGVALVGLRNAGHVGRIGAWAEQAIAANMASIHFVNVVSALLVAPFGGAERRMSTNPVCVGIPNRHGDDFLLDFATSRVAEGKVLVAQKAGKKVDPRSLVDANGQPTDDPVSLYGEVGDGDVPDARKGPGAMTPMGEHKGSGLGIACELLAGALTGSGTSSEGARVHNGMLSIYIDPDILDDGHAWSDSVKEYIDFVRSSEPADTDSPVMIPGDPERRARAHRLEHGAPLDSGSWNNILDAGERLGLTRDAMMAKLNSSV